MVWIYNYENYIWYGYIIMKNGSDCSDKKNGDMSREYLITN